MRGKPQIPKSSHNNIEDLELHEQLVIRTTSKGKLVVTRVKSGWIYERKVESEYQSSVFVPEQNNS